MKYPLKHVLTTFASHFVLCFFLGLITLTMLTSLSAVDYLHLLQHNGLFGLLCLGMVNGVLVGGITFAFHWHLQNKGHASFRCHGQTPIYTTWQYASVGFICGLIPVFIMMSSTGLLLLTAIIILLVWYNLKIFARNMAHILAPETYATWEEVGQLLRVWITILAAFTMINTSLEIWHKLFTPNEIAFGFQGRGEMLLDALYFSTVIMTTLGFGDIIPHTPGAKTLVIIESLIGYVMFALMVGVVTRGVRSSNKNVHKSGVKKNNPKEKNTQ